LREYVYVFRIVFEGYYDGMKNSEALWVLMPMEIKLQYQQAIVASMTQSKTGGIYSRFSSAFSEGDGDAILTIKKILEITTDKQKEELKEILDVIAWDVRLMQTWTHYGASSVVERYLQTIGVLPESLIENTGQIVGQHQLYDEQLLKIYNNVRNKNGAYFDLLNHKGVSRHTWNNLGAEVGDTGITFLEYMKNANKKLVDNVGSGSKNVDDLADFLETVKGGYNIQSMSIDPQGIEDLSRTRFPNFRFGDSHNGIGDYEVDFYTDVNPDGLPYLKFDRNGPKKASNLITSVSDFITVKSTTGEYAEVPLKEFAPDIWYQFSKYGKLQIDDVTNRNIFNRDLADWTFTHTDGNQYEIVFIKELEEQVGLWKLLRGGEEGADENILPLLYVLSMERSIELSKRPEEIRIIGGTVDSSDAVVKDIYPQLDHPNAHIYLPGTNEEMTLHDIWSRVVVGHTTADSTHPFKPITLGDLDNPSNGGFTRKEIASLKLEVTEGEEVDSVVDYFVYNFILPNDVTNNVFEGNYYSRGWNRVGSTGAPSDLQDFIIPIGSPGDADSIDTYVRYELDMNAYLQSHSLVMYSDDSVISKIGDKLGDIVDKTGTAGFFFFIGFNTALWWGKIGFGLFKTFQNIKAIIKKYFEW